MDFLGFWSSQASIWGSENIKMTVLGAQMELWGRLQHNTVRDSRYGPLGTEKTSFGELSGRSEKKFFFFPSYKNGSTNLMSQLEKSADI